MGSQGGPPQRPAAVQLDPPPRSKDFGAARFPFVDIGANRAWLAVVCFADVLRFNVVPSYPHTRASSPATYHRFDADG